jgi:hypothetical protein
VIPAHLSGYVKVNEVAIGSIALPIDVDLGINKRLNKGRKTIQDVLKIVFFMTSPTT